MTHPAVEPTPDGGDIDAFARDGFLIIRRLLDDQAVARIRDRFQRLFACDYPTGIQPDEVKWVEGRDPESVPRQICNAWKADHDFARDILSVRLGEIATRLMGWDGVRLLQDVCIWRPPAADFLPMHRDGTRLAYVVPPESVTCWLALDATSGDCGAITYAATSHRWPPSKPGRYRVETTADWLEPALRALPVGERLELIRVDLGAGDAVFHRFDTFHGYGPGSGGGHSRGVIVHLAPVDAEFHPTEVDPVYSRYRRAGDPAMDESFFPIIWSRDGRRSRVLNSQEPR